MPSGSVSGGLADTDFPPRTLTLFRFALLVWTPVYACLQNLILTLELIFELILKVAHFVRLVNLHGTISIFDRLLLLL
jgi:hypothetical protein